MKLSFLPVKIILFTAIFFVLTFIVSLLLCDEQTSYSRIFMHELYSEERIDNIFLGASHVSHSVLPPLLDDLTGEKSFCTGSAGQTIEASYAILRQAAKIHKIKRAFLELDFAVATYPPVRERTGFKAAYIIAKHLRDPKIKFEYLFTMSSPKYWINSILPIGKDKHMTLKPEDLLFRWKSFITGDYFKYIYVDKDAEYGGKGCLLDIRLVKNGSFSNDFDEGRIRVNEVSDDWKNVVDKIIALCKENDIELILYSMPCSDFYLAEKQNYDEYYQFVKEFCASRGFPYYDFNLVSEKYLTLEDSDFHDDNHFSKQGVVKWTHLMADVINTSESLNGMFYNSWSEKISHQEPKIYGLVFLTADDRKSIEIVPMRNNVPDDAISYEVYEQHDGEESLIATEMTGGGTVINLPDGVSGNVRVRSFINGVQQTECSKHFSTAL